MATCDSMCPVAEIRFRSKNLLINRLEATPESCNGPRAQYVADPEKMVKEYCRSAADTHKYNKPELLRPFSVLRGTIDYLLQLYAPFKDRRELVKSSEFSSMFSFVSDRLRAVRQDMIMQGMSGKKSAYLIEKMLPFYIETDGMCKMEKCSSFDHKLHDFQLEECFGRWFEEVSAGFKPDSLISKCFFFRQLHRKPTILHDLYILRPRLAPRVFDSTREVISAFQSVNYYRFFFIVHAMEPTEQYSLSDAISHIRKVAMKNIAFSFKTPVAKLHTRIMAIWLGFSANPELFDNFLRLYNVTPDSFGCILVSAIHPVDIPDLEFSSRQY